MKDSMWFRPIRPRTVICLCVVLFLLLVVVVAGRKHSPWGYRMVLHDGLHVIPYVREFGELYPDSQYHISYFTGQFGKTTWISKVGLYGRYILTMEVPIEPNFWRTGIEEYGSPHFILLEVESVIMEGKSVRGYNAGKTQKHFGENEWQAIVDRGGDIGALGIPVTRDRPLEGFDRCWRDLPGWLDQ